MTDILNQCLFCTSKPDPHPQSVGYGAAAAFAIWCQNCGAQGPECKTPKEAIQRWNNAQVQEFKRSEIPVNAGRFEAYRDIWRSFQSNKIMEYRAAKRWMLGFMERYINEVEGTRKELYMDQISAFFEMPRPPVRESGERKLGCLWRTRMVHAGSAQTVAPCPPKNSAR